MSRIGKMPILLPRSVEVRIDGNTVTVKGPKGELARDILPEIEIKQEDGQLLVSRPTDQQRHRAMHGLTRTLVDNMVRGVSEGFSKTLEMQGVGYRAQMQGNDLQLSIGFSHPVTVPPPAGIEFEVEGTSRIVVKGINKEQVGQIDADVRKKRPPEPYKGKGR